jgi:phosphoglycerate dehydrogenase-like enzyme
MMDCHITGVRRVVRDIPKEFDAMITLEQVDQVLPEADIVICCMPHTPLTQGFMNRARFEKMKSTAIFVNVGRGTLVDHNALADVLNAGKIYGAALDVTYPEPLPQDHPLWKCRNVMITPHVSGQTFAGLSDKADYFFQICKQNLENYRDGKPLANQVDLKTGYRVTTN